MSSQRKRGRASPTSFGDSHPGSSSSSSSQPVTQILFTAASSLRSSSVISRRAALQKILSTLSSSSSRSSLLSTALASHPPSSSGNARIAVSHLYNLLIESSLQALSLTLAVPSSTSSSSSSSHPQNPLTKKKTPVEDAAFLAKLLRLLSLDLTAPTDKYAALPLPRGGGIFRREGGGEGMGEGGLAVTLLT